MHCIEKYPEILAEDSIILYATRSCIYIVGMSGKKYPSISSTSSTGNSSTTVWSKNSCQHQSSLLDFHVFHDKNAPAFCITANRMNCHCNFSVPGLWDIFFTSKAFSVMVHLTFTFNCYTSPTFKHCSSDNVRIVYHFTRQSFLITYFQPRLNADICKNIFACLFSISNMISESGHEHVCLMSVSCKTRNHPQTSQTTHKLHRPNTNQPRSHKSVKTYKSQPSYPQTSQTIIK